MAITTLDALIQSAKQYVTLNKTATRTTVATGWFSVFDLAGNPGAGILAAGNTANGIVPTDLTTGYPVMNAFGSSNTGYITGIQFGSSVACRLLISDRLFVAGSYSFNANVTLTIQPSYLLRLPNSDYKGLEIWVEQVTAATGNQAVTVTYTNQDGVAGRTTGAVGIGAAPTLGRCWQLPLQAGDTGVQKIESVVGTVATAGTFNVMVLRRLTTCRVKVANDGGILSFTDTGMPIIKEDSALYMMAAADSTSSGIPEVLMTVVNG
jgi:hypothetical protein